MSDSRVRKVPIEESKRTLFVADTSITSTLHRKYIEKKAVRRVKLIEPPRNGKKN